MSSAAPSRAAAATAGQPVRPPITISQHPHQLLWKLPYNGRPWNCDVCTAKSVSLNETYHYHCTDCGWDACSKCASVGKPAVSSPPVVKKPAAVSRARDAGTLPPRPPVTVAQHPHQLIWKLPYDGQGWKCDICGASNGVTLENMYNYHCDECNWDACRNCAAQFSSMRLNDTVSFWIPNSTATVLPTEGDQHTWTASSGGVFCPYSAPFDGNETDCYYFEVEKYSGKGTVEMGWLDEKFIARWNESLLNYGGSDLERGWFTAMRSRPPSEDSRVMFLEPLLNSVRNGLWPASPQKSGTVGCGIELRRPLGAPQGEYLIWFCFDNNKKVPAFLVPETLRIFPAVLMRGDSHRGVPETVFRINVGQRPFRYSFDPQPKPLQALATRVPRAPSALPFVECICVPCSFWNKLLSQTERFYRCLHCTAVQKGDRVWHYDVCPLMITFHKTKHPPNPASSLLGETYESLLKGVDAKAFTPCFSLQQDCTCSACGASEIYGTVYRSAKFPRVNICYGCWRRLQIPIANTPYYPFVMIHVFAISPLPKIQLIQSEPIPPALLQQLLTSNSSPASTPALSQSVSSSSSSVEVVSFTTATEELQKQRALEDLGVAEQIFDADTAAAVVTQKKDTVYSIMSEEDGALSKGLPSPYAASPRLSESTASAPRSAYAAASLPPSSAGRYAEPSPHSPSPYAEAQGMEKQLGQGAYATASVSSSPYTAAPSVANAYASVSHAESPYATALTIPNPYASVSEPATAPYAAAPALEQPTAASCYGLPTQSHTPYSEVLASDGNVAASVAQPAASAAKLASTKPKIPPATPLTNSAVEAAPPAVSAVQPPQVPQAMINNEGIRQWNEEFQRILNMPTFTAEEVRSRGAALQKLGDDFLTQASSLARVIISEIHLPDAQKTIKPKTMGGIAGGAKFMERGIFMKFATDLHGLYGGDTFALKAAGHELMGLKLYFQCAIPGLHQPLMALIDYRGWRLICTSALPLGKDTLRYGSDNAGETVHADDTKLNEMMEEAAKQINIKKHLTGFKEKKMLAAPCDIEGHLGKDGRYYVVDTARVMPPEKMWRSLVGIVLPADLPKTDFLGDQNNDPYRRGMSREDATLFGRPYNCELNPKCWQQDVANLLGGAEFNKLQSHLAGDNTVFSTGQGSRNTFASLLTASPVLGDAVMVFSFGLKGKSLYALLRPELVKRSMVPLSSDAFTAFGNDNAKEHNDEVREACDRLIDEIIPQLAKDVNEGRVRIAVASETSTVLHQAGVNVRYEGVLLCHLTNDAAIEPVLSDMIARTIKGIAAVPLRRARTEAEYIRIAMHWFNLLLSNSVDSDIFWRVVLNVAIQAKYGKYGHLKFFATEENREASNFPPLRKMVAPVTLHNSLKHALGIEFRIDFEQKLYEERLLAEGAQPYTVDAVQSLTVSANHLLDNVEEACLQQLRGADSSHFRNFTDSQMLQSDLSHIGAIFGPTHERTVRAELRLALSYCWRSPPDAPSLRDLLVQIRSHMEVFQGRPPLKLGIALFYCEGILRCQTDAPSAAEFFWKAIQASLQLSSASPSLQFASGMRDVPNYIAWARTIIPYHPFVTLLFNEALQCARGVKWPRKLIQETVLTYQQKILKNITLPTEPELLQRLYHTLRPDPFRADHTYDLWNFAALPHDWRRTMLIFDVTEGSLRQRYVPLSEPDAATPRAYTAKPPVIQGPLYLEKGRPLKVTVLATLKWSNSDIKYLCYRRWQPSFKDSNWVGEWAGLKRVPLPWASLVGHTAEIDIAADTLSEEGMYWFSLEKEESGRPRPVAHYAVAVGSKDLVSRTWHLFQHFHGNDDHKATPFLVPSPYLSPGWPKTIPNAASIKVQKLVAGCGSFFALTNQGVFAWGLNDYGQLGVGDTEERKTPELVRSLSQKGREIVDLSINKEDTFSTHTLACTVTGEVLSWGSDRYALLGYAMHRDGTARGNMNPLTIESSALKNICKVRAGDLASFAISKDGKIFGWGQASMCGHPAAQVQPKLIAFFDDIPVRDVDTCGKYVTVLAMDGRIFGWNDGTTSIRRHNIAACHYMKDEIWVEVAHTKSSAYLLNNRGEVYRYGERARAGALDLINSPAACAHVDPFVSPDDIRPDGARATSAPPVRILLYGFSNDRVVRLVGGCSAAHLITESGKVFYATDEHGPVLLTRVSHERIVAAASSLRWNFEEGYLLSSSEPIPLPFIDERPILEKRAAAAAEASAAEERQKMQEQSKTAANAPPVSAAPLTLAPKQPAAAKGAAAVAPAVPKAPSPLATSSGSSATVSTASEPNPPARPFDQLSETELEPLRAQWSASADPHTYQQSIDGWMQTLKANPHFPLDTLKMNIQSLEKTLCIQPSPSMCGTWKGYVEALRTVTERSSASQAAPKAMEPSLDDDEVKGYINMYRTSFASKTPEEAVQALKMTLPYLPVDQPKLRAAVQFLVRDYETARSGSSSAHPDQAKTRSIPIVTSPVTPLPLAPPAVSSSSASASPAKALAPDEAFSKLNNDQKHTAQQLYEGFKSSYATLERKVAISSLKASLCAYKAQPEVFAPHLCAIKRYLAELGVDLADISTANSKAIPPLSADQLPQSQGIYDQYKTSLASLTKAQAVQSLTQTLDMLLDSDSAHLPAIHAVQRLKTELERDIATTSSAITPSAITSAETKDSDLPPLPAPLHPTRDQLYNRFKETYGKLAKPHAIASLNKLIQTTPAGGSGAQLASLHALTKLKVELESSLGTEENSQVVAASPPVMQASLRLAPAVKPLPKAGSTDATAAVAKPVAKSAPSPSAPPPSVAQPTQNPLQALSGMWQEDIYREREGRDRKMDTQKDLIRKRKREKRRTERMTEGKGVDLS